nr:MAG TPA: hypothetical protein [Caudoviricetes sp.]
MGNHKMQGIKSLCDNTMAAKRSGPSMASTITVRSTPPASTPTPRPRSSASWTSSAPTARRPRPSGSTSWRCSRCSAASPA